MAAADVRVSEYGLRNSYHHQMSYKDYLKKVIIAKPLYYILHDIICDVTNVQVYYYVTKWWFLQ